MSFTLKDVLNAVGGNASLVFAAWIFLTYLQARYSAAFSVYRTLIDSHRNGLEGPQQASVERQIALYLKRCEQMRQATTLGIVSAMLLILALLCGGASVVFPDVAVFKYLGTACVLFGLLSVIGSATFVVLENTSVRQALDAEMATLAKPGSSARAARGDAERPRR